MIGHGTATVEVKAIDPNTYGRAHQFAAKNRINQLAATSKARQVAANRNRNNIRSIKSRRLKLIGSKSDKETGV